MTRYEPIMPQPDAVDPLDLALLAAHAIDDDASRWLDVAVGALFGAIIAFIAGSSWALHTATFTPFWIGFIAAIALVGICGGIADLIVRPRLEAASALCEHVRQALDG